jgi:hypothetical protein
MSADPCLVRSAIGSDPFMHRLGARRRLSLYPHRLSRCAYGLPMNRKAARDEERKEIYTDILACAGALLGLVMDPV